MAQSSAGTMRISADEINLLVYSYLQDSGFTHAAFNLCTEARLKHSHLFQKHIPRGELIELLSKALLYVEVESHFRGDVANLTCKSGFSLLEPHVCSNVPPPQLPLVRPRLSPSQNTKPNLQNGTPILISDNKNGIKPATTDSDPKRNPDAMQIDAPEVVKEDDSYYIPPPPAAIVNALKDNIRNPKTIQAPSEKKTNPAAVIWLYPRHTAEVFVAAWNPKHLDLLATGSKDSSIYLWNVPRNTPNSIKPPDNHPPKVINVPIKKNSEGDMTSLHWSPDGSLLAVGSYDTILRIFDIQGNQYFSHPQHMGPIFAVEFSPNGSFLATASLDGTSALWHVKDKKLLRQWRCHQDCCLSVTWINDNTLATCGADSKIFILRTDRALPLKSLNGHASEVNQLKFNTKKNRLASCSDDSTARVWNVEDIMNQLEAEDELIPGLSSAASPLVLEGHKQSVSLTRWSPPDSKGWNPFLATSSFDGTARVWDPTTGACLHLLTGHSKPIYAMNFHPTGRWLATGGGDGWVHIFDFKNGTKAWSWYAGPEHPGVFEIEWQINEKADIDRIALALECRKVIVLDTKKIDALLL